MEYSIEDDTMPTNIYTTIDDNSDPEHYKLEISDDENQNDEDQFLVSYLNIIFEIELGDEMIWRRHLPD